MDFLPGRLAASFNALSPLRKLLLAATGGGAVALALLLYSWSARTDYVPLYSGLDASDSGRIVDQLRSQGVPFQLDGGGSTVRVPESELDELRLNFAAQGLPEGGSVGFELFDGNAFTATDFVQRLNFQRGLQGELARTISSFASIENTRVHIVLPERSLFIDDERPATASVVLALRPGTVLDSSEVVAIAFLVSGAVERLDKSNITIVDTAGAVLYDGAQVAANDSLGIGASNLDLQRNFERALEQDVQAMLDRALGAGLSTVRIRATLNFDRLETETESFNPITDDEGVVRSTTEVTESYSATGAAVAAGSVPGATANVPGADTSLPDPAADGDDATGSSTSYTRSETVANFEIGRTVTRSVRAPGMIEQLSVSLLLDDSVTPEQGAMLRDAVAAAVGIDASRGDVVAFGTLPFNRSAVAEAEAAFAAEASQQQLMGYARMGLPVVVLLIAFFFFRLLMGSVNKRAAYAVAVTDGALAAALPAASAGAELPAGGRLQALMPPPSEETRSQVETEVSRLAQERPDSVAEVVQAWLRDE